MTRPMAPCQKLWLGLKHVNCPDWSVAPCVSRSFRIALIRRRMPPKRSRAAPPEVFDDPRRAQHRSKGRTLRRALPRDDLHWHPPRPKGRGFSRHLMKASPPQIFFASAIFFDGSVGFSPLCSAPSALLRLMPSSAVHKAVFHSRLAAPRTDPVSAWAASPSNSFAASSDNPFFAPDKNSIIGPFSLKS